MSDVIPASPTPAPSPAPAPAPSPDPSPAAWHAGADPEILGHLQNHGWHDKPANEVALAAAKSHREAMKSLHHPPEQIIRLPANMNDAVAMAPVWERLGAPKDVTGYDLSGVKFSDGSDLDPTFSDFFKAQAATLKLPKDTATALAGQFAKFLEGQEAAENTETAAALATARDKLKANWGNNHEANMFVAKQAAQALGVTPAEVQALEGLVGYDRVMEMFRSIGVKTGEARYVEGGRPAGNGVMTKEQAVARRGDLLADAAWAKRWSEGGAVEQREMMGLNVLISGDSTGI